MYLIVLFGLTQSSLPYLHIKWDHWNFTECPRKCDEPHGMAYHTRKCLLCDEFSNCTVRNKLCFGSTTSTIKMECYTSECSGEGNIRGNWTDWTSFDKCSPKNIREKIVRDCAEGRITMIKYCSSPSSNITCPTEFIKQKFPCIVGECKKIYVEEWGEWKCRENTCNSAVFYDIGAIQNIYRTRKCRLGNNTLVRCSFHTDIIEKKLCHDISRFPRCLDVPQGWTYWSPWSSCIDGDCKTPSARFRHRNCILKKEKCIGRSYDLSFCFGGIKCEATTLQTTGDRLVALKLGLWTARNQHVIHPGDNMLIDCNNEGDVEKQKDKVMWKKNGMPLRFKTGLEVDGTTLVKQEVDFTDKGIYTCEVQKTSSMTEIYDVHVVTVIGNASYKIIAEMNSNVTLNCNLDYFRTLFPYSYTIWFHDDFIALNTKTAHSGSLLIPNIKSTAAGNWSCYAVEPSTVRKWLMETYTVDVVKPRNVFIRVITKTRNVAVIVFFILFVVLMISGTFAVGKIMVINHRNDLIRKYKMDL